MRNPRRGAASASLAACVLLLILAACAESSDPAPGPTASLRVLHTAAGVSAVDVLVGGSAVIRNLAVGDVSSFVSVAAGTRQVIIRPAGSSGAVPATAMTFSAGDSITVLTIDSASVLNPWALTDTGAVVPADKSKLRVVHAAAATPNIDIWRTQPSFQTYSAIMFPFPYQAESGYIQSDPGDWRILVSTETRDGNGIPVLVDTLLETAPITIPAGESRTVIVMDQPGGGLQAQVITP